MEQSSSNELNQPKSNKRRLSWVVNSFILLSFLAVIFYGLAVFAFGQEDKISDTEGRSLEARPDFSVGTFLDGTYTEKFESSANDQVFRRDLWIEGQAWFQRNILRQEMNNGIISVDSVLYEPEAEEMQYTSLGEFLKEFQASMKQLDVPVYFASAPSKPVYGGRNDLLPDYIESYDVENRDHLHDRIQEANIPLIDLEEPFNQYDGEEIYFKTDHHWRAEGAFIAYTEIMNELKGNYPGLRILTETDMETKKVEGPFYGSNAREISLVYVEEPDEFTYLEPKNGFSTTVCRNVDDCGHEVLDRDVLKGATDFTNYFNLFMGDNYAQVKIEQENPVNDYHVLVLKDSYANPILGYLGESFGTVSAIDVRYTEGKVDITDYIEKNEVDLVLFMHNDRISGMGSDYEDAF